MEQEHRITYKAGITRKPSDFLCQDGELAECINLTTDNEELKPVVQPEEKHSIGNADTTLVYVHKFGEKVRYIFLVKDQQHTYLVKWCNVTSSGLGTMTTLKDTGGVNNLELQMDENDLPGFGRQITSVGKMLTLIGKESGKSECLMHFVWKGDTYSKSLVIPQQNADFRLVNITQKGSSGKIGDALDGDVISDQEQWNDLLVGLYSKNVKTISENKRFCKPFLVRTAIELYDGSYFYISQPMMMFACVRENSFARRRSDEMSMYTWGLDLEMMQKTDLTAYKDFVKDVVVFVTNGVDPHELSADHGAHFLSNTQGVIYTDAVWCNSISLPNLGMTYVKDTNITGNNDLLKVPLTQKEVNDIKTELESSSIFYRLCSVGLSPLTGWTDLKKYIKPHTLENLTTQARLETDDYFSRCSIDPEFLYSYNSRLNMSGVKRGFFEGFGKFLPYMSKRTSQAYYNTNTNTAYSFYVEIETDDGIMTVRHVETYTTEDKASYYQGIFFYYPDPRARHVWIYVVSGNSEGFLCDMDLKEHPGLNGAYYFRGLPGYGGEEPTNQSQTRQYGTSNNYATEYMPNYILTSEVNNPWVFKAEGYNRVGTGRIIGISTVTQALSQGQFGEYPLLVFSESGIWAMNVDNTGLYQSILPMSREVCINPRSIIQTDGAVFFVSKKGLMVIVGNDVRCVSEQMNGAAFNTKRIISFTNPSSADPAAQPWKNVIEACQSDYSFQSYILRNDLIMAYDYADSRIIITSPFFSYSFVYNIADGTISKVVMPALITGAVNNYPDYLLQGDTVTEENNEQTITRKIYTVYGKPREELVQGRAMAFLLTRPMKLAGPVSQASLRQLMNVGTWDKGTTLTPLSCVKTELFLSEDMKTWYPDISRFGAAARYYRLALYIKMLPVERLSGTIITEQERRGNNMR